MCVTKCYEMSQKCNIKMCVTKCYKMSQNATYSYVSILSCIEMCVTKCHKCNKNVIHIRVIYN